MTNIDPALEPDEDELRGASELDEDELKPAAEDVEDDEDEIEAKARRAGWKPKDEYTGPEGKWKPAAEFLEGLDDYPVLKERYDNLDNRFGRLENELNDVKSKLSESGQVIQDMHAQNKKIRETAYEKARKDIERERREAAETADIEAYDAADKKLQELEEQRAEEEKPSKPAEPEPEDGKDKPRDPVIEAWVAKNSWFNDDDVLYNFAVAYHGQLKREKPELSMADNLEQVTKEVQRRFPEKFGNVRREDPPATGGTAGGRSKPKKRTYEALPKDARDECDRTVRQMQLAGAKDYTKEQWVKDYFDQEDE